MEIQVTEIEPFKLAVTYSSGVEEILNKKAEIVSTFKKAPIKGFRPGKAPTEVISRIYRNQIDESLKRALCEDAFHNTLFEKNIKAHGAPKFNSAQLIGNSFTCQFEMNSKPNFDLADLTAVEVVRPASDTDVPAHTEKMLQELRVKHGDQVPFSADDFVQNGDNIIIDYEGTVDGEKIEAICAEGEMVTVGASALVQFDQELLGMKTGESKEFDLVVPETGLPSIAGKTVHFKVTLNIGSKNVPCALDDTLAQKVGKETFQEVRDFVAASAAGQLHKKSKQDLISAISVKLVDAHSFDVPEWMALSEAQYLVQQSKVNWDTLAQVDKDRYVEMAAKNVKLALILEKVREDHPEALLTDHEVFQIVKDNIARTKTTASMEDIIKEMSKNGYLQVLFSRIKDEYAMDFISKTIKVVE